MNQQVNFNRVTCCQIWQAFIQETIHTVASASGQDLILRNSLAIDEVVTEAFAVLEKNGVITAAENHSCSECIQEYRQQADIIFAASGANGLIENPMDDERIEELEVTTERTGANRPIVTMAVLDGIVMGPSVCCSSMLFFKIPSNIFLALCL